MDRTSGASCLWRISAGSPFPSPTLCAITFTQRRQARQPVSSVRVCCFVCVFCGFLSLMFGIVLTCCMTIRVEIYALPVGSIAHVAVTMVFKKLAPFFVYRCRCQSRAGGPNANALLPYPMIRGKCTLLPKVGRKAVSHKCFLK
jgi:hypothetical protein